MLVIIDNFNKFGWTVLHKNKNAQKIKDSFKKILLSSKIKPGLFETDRAKEFYNNMFQDLLKKQYQTLFKKHTPWSCFCRTLYSYY